MGWEVRDEDLGPGAGEEAEEVWDGGEKFDVAAVAGVQEEEGLGGGCGGG
jgi:hypothetical protein